MSEQMNNECLVRCKHCGTVTTAEWNKGVLGLGKGWRLKDTKGSCPVCHQYINIDNLETALCPHCGKLVEKTEDGICINCHKSLAATVYRSQVECPQCGILVSVPEDPEFSCRCEICGTELTADYIRSRLAQKKVDTEQYILLPDTARMRAQDLVIWKHPQSSFPFKSRLQVNEGTYALFLQNGICRDPYDPGTYLLEKSDLTVSQKLDAAMDDDNVIFRTDVYCVLRDLNEFGWGALADIASSSGEEKDSDRHVETDPFRNQEKTASWTASGNGRIALQVCDAKAFAQFVGFGEISLSGLTKVNPLGSEDGPLITLVRNQMSEALYACTNGMKEAELELLTATEIKDRLVQELDNRLAQNGLCVKTLQIKDLAVKKTGKSEITDRIRDQVQSSFTWMVPAVRLHLPGEPNYYADVTFTGSGRVRIVNEAGFWSLSEVKKLIAASGAGPLSAGLTSSGSADADVLGRDKVTAALKTALPLTAQNQIDRGDIRDLTDPAQYVTALQDLYSRGGFSDGYYFRRKGPVMMSMARPNHLGSKAAVVKTDKERNKTAAAAETLYPMDVLEVPGQIPGGSSQKSPSSAGKPLEFQVGSSIPAGGSFRLPDKMRHLKNGTTLYRTRCESLLRKIREDIIDRPKKEKIKGELILFSGKPAILNLGFGEIRTSTAGPEPQPAVSRPLTEEAILKQLSKTGDTPFEFEDLRVQMTDGLFLPLQAINALRRDALEQLETEILAFRYRERCALADSLQADICTPSVLPEGPGTQGAQEAASVLDLPEGLMISVSSAEQLRQAALFAEEGRRICAVIGPVQLWSEEDAQREAASLKAGGCLIFAELPQILRMDTAEKLKKDPALRKVLDSADGLVVRTLDAAGFLLQEGFRKPLFGSSGLYAYNTAAVQVLSDLGISGRLLPDA